MSSPPPPNPTTTTTSSSNAAPTLDYLNSLVVRQGAINQLHPAIYQNLRNPQSTTTTTTTTPPFPPPPPSQRQQRPQPPGGGGVLYPVASSGRGFIPKHHHDQNSVYPPYRPNGFSNSGQHSHQLYQTLMGGGSVMPTGATGVLVSANPKGGESGRGVAKRLFIDLNERPVEDETVDPNDQPKVAGQSSFADDKSLKNARDKNGDDTFVMIRDRKVQISEGTSLYAQCRSWLKNGYTLENQPQYVDCMKSLPKPLPASVVEARKEDIEMEKTEDVENMSVKELLQQHVRHAKKVRARLRNQRLQRIERYKDRLALLLPPVVDQQPRNDATS